MTPAAQPPVLVAPITSRDFVSLAALAGELAAHHGDKHAPAASALERDYGSWYEARLARAASGQDVGFVTWERFYASECAERGMEIRNLYVKADVRGQGVGRTLLCAAIKAALAAECQRLRLGVRKDNAIGVRFYKQFGCTMYDMGNAWGCRWDRGGMLGILEATGAAG